MNTLAALCFAHGLDLEEAAEAELARVWTKIEKIRAKRAAKPRFGPLPGPDPLPDLIRDLEIVPETIARRAPVRRQASRSSSTGSSRQPAQTARESQGRPRTVPRLPIYLRRPPRPSSPGFWRLERAMRTVKWFLSMDLVGAKREGEIEVDDDATAEDIDREVREAAFQHIEWGWDEERKDEGGGNETPREPADA